MPSNVRERLAEERSALSSAHGGQTRCLERERDERPRQATDPRMELVEAATKEREKRVDDSAHQRTNSTKAVRELHLLNGFGRPSYFDALRCLSEEDYAFDVVPAAEFAPEPGVEAPHVEKADLEIATALREKEEVDLLAATTAISAVQPAVKQNVARPSVQFFEEKGFATKTAGLNVNDVKAKSAMAETAISAATTELDELRACHALELLEKEEFLAAVEALGRELPAEEVAEILKAFELVKGHATKTANTNIKDLTTSSRCPHGFRVGDRASVWSYSAWAWVHDGLIVEVAEDDLLRDGEWFPAGSVGVSYNAGETEKYLMPNECDEELWRLPNSSLCSGLTNINDDEAGPQPYHAKDEVDSAKPFAWKKGSPRQDERAARLAE
eukprot:NODE_7115_length_1607_cov_5.087162.p1 GENE.NODE_7115_length_1607_cov_5.087162~~NODE_7115_length_1607_cov_5.087162.p1  ORF type:complete len:386 (-),score=114.65 NODE_7115_length_1607_cov_5.087162:450-1607(-)